MNEIVNAYIQQSGLDKTQAQQLMQELQALDETQLQQVLGKMQQQLQSSPMQQAPQQMEEGMMMQYGGYEKWKKALPKNLQSTDTTLYNLRGAYEGGLIPEMNEDGLYHLGSRNPKTGELLKNPKHPTFNKMIEGEAQAGYEVYEKNGKLYSRPKSKQQYGGIPVDEDGVFAVGKNPVVVPTRGTGQISMEGVDFPIDSYDADTMQYLDTMQPNQEYQFDGVDNVLEIPQAKFGIQKMQAGGKTNLKKKANGKFVDENGNEYVYNPRNNTFVTGWNYKATPVDSFNVEDFNLTKEEKQKFASKPATNKELQAKPNVVEFKGKSGKKYKAIYDPQSGFYLDGGGNWWDIDKGISPVLVQSGVKQDIDTKEILKKRNTPVEAIGNSNLKVGDKVDTVGKTPVQEYRTTTKSNDDKFGFVTGLKRNASCV